MSESDHDPTTDPVQRLHTHNVEVDKNYRDNHVPIAHDLLSWLHRAGETASAVVRVERMRRQNPRMYRTLMAKAAELDVRRILSRIAYNAPMSVNRIAEVMDVSERTVNRRLSALYTVEALEKRAGRPPYVALASDNAEILTKDVLSYYTLHTENKVTKDPVRENNKGADHVPMSTKTAENGKRGESG